MLVCVLIAGLTPRRRAWASALVLFLSILSMNVTAHGGVSLEDDLCIMRIGSMRAHFTGYQPKVRASQEFCEDIPELGEAIIVLDFMNPALRKMEIGFRVIKETTGRGARTTYNDIQALLKNPDNILSERAPDQYATGSFNVSLSIKEPGWYVGVLTALDPETETQIISAFPFSVGLKDYVGVLMWGCAIVLLGIAFYFLSGRRNNPQPLVEQKDIKTTDEGSP
jgi:hypothetical protein